MSKRTRREVLADVGAGMFLASLGTTVASDLGLGAAWASEEPGRLTFGDLEPLVAFMQETPTDKLLPKAVEKFHNGTSLKQLVAAAALANARAFGGEDYVGFHTLMALVPAYHMSAEEHDKTRRPLAVLKVLVRNANRLRESGHATKDTLHPVPGGGRASHRPTGEDLRDAARKANLPDAERAFAAIAGGAPADALDQLMLMVDDATEVHRTVLVSRSWELLDFVGTERAHTLLRQSVHYCVSSEKHPSYVKRYQGVRALLPKLLDQHKLLSRPVGSRSADDAWVARMSETLFRGTPERAAEAAAAALAEGMSAGAIGEAISLAANQLVLRDAGRTAAQAEPGKPAGSVHGASIGVHACDSANAWRNLAHFGGLRTQVSSLILGAYQVARDRAERGGAFLQWQPYPRAEHLEKVRGVADDKLLAELGAAVRRKDQPRAAALAQRLGDAKADAAQVFALLRNFAVSEDGALHGEKYYRTTTEEFARSRPAFRWRHVVALARVTASAYGQPAPGYDEACGLLKG
jgi:hypothetical protein